MAKGRPSASETCAETQARERFQSFQVSQVIPITATTASARTRVSTQRKIDVRGGASVGDTLGR